MIVESLHPGTWSQPEPMAIDWQPSLVSFPLILPSLCHFILGHLRIVLIIHLVAAAHSAYKKEKLEEILPFRVTGTFWAGGQLQLWNGRVREFPVFKMTMLRAGVIGDLKPSLSPLSPPNTSYWNICLIFPTPSSWRPFLLYNRSQIVSFSWIEPYGMAGIWSLLTYKMVQPHLVWGFLLSRREKHPSEWELKTAPPLGGRQWGQRKGFPAPFPGVSTADGPPNALTSASVWQVHAGWNGEEKHQAPRDIGFTDESRTPTKSKQVVVVEKCKTTVSSVELQNIAYMHTRRSTFNLLYYSCLGRCRASIFFFSHVLSGSCFPRLVKFAFPHIFVSG